MRLMEPNNPLKKLCAFHEKASQVYNVIDFKKSIMTYKILLSVIILKVARFVLVMLPSALLSGPAIGPVHVRFRNRELQPLWRSL